MDKDRVEFRCVAYKTDTLDGNFIKGRVYEADNMALDAENERYIACDGTFDSLIRTDPTVEKYLYPLRDGEDAEYAQRFINEIRYKDKLKYKYLPDIDLMFMEMTSCGAIIYDDESGYVTLARISEVERVS